MQELEKDIERKLRRIVKAHGGQCLKFVSPGESGVPDRIVLLPGGRLIFIETKRPRGGVVSKLQKYWHRKLQGLGFEAGFIFNNDDLEQFKKTLEEKTNGA